MYLKNSPFSIQDNDIKDLDNLSRKYPIPDDFMADKNISTERSNTVHRRRDLDSLG